MYDPFNLYFLAGDRPIGNREQKILDFTINALSWMCHNVHDN